MNRASGKTPYGCDEPLRDRTAPTTPGSSAIWKYHLGPALNIVAMPAGARLLTAQVQRGALVLWALVDPGMRARSRQVYVAPTGEVPARLATATYVATVQVHSGDLVWHIFDGGEAL